MATLLGEVEKYTGVIRFQDMDVNMCRIFLISHGLDCKYDGWHSDDKIGAIYYNGINRGWTAAYWYRTNQKLEAVV